MHGVAALIFDFNILEIKGKLIYFYFALMFLWKDVEQERVSSPFLKQSRASS